MDRPPLPKSVLRLLLAAVISMASLVLGLHFAMPTLRQAQLLDEAHKVTLERSTEATRWLEREPTISAALDRERREAFNRLPHLLRTDEAVQIRTWLQALARDAGLEAAGCMNWRPGRVERKERMKDSIARGGRRRALHRRIASNAILADCALACSAPGEPVGWSFQFPGVSRIWTN